MDADTNGHDYPDDVSSCGGEEDEELTWKPSAKALGKRKVVEPEALPEREYSRASSSNILIACFYI